MKVLGHPGHDIPNKTKLKLESCWVFLKAHVKIYVTKIFQPRSYLESGASGH